MNYYQPQQTKIKNIKKVNDNLNIFVFTPGNNQFTPGQFFMLSLPGFSEAPFTPTNYPNKKNIEFLIQKKDKGLFTQKLFTLKPNDIISIRGPYGNGFDFDRLKGKNIALIAGGCGLAPLMSALEYLYRKNSGFGQIQLFYGVDRPNEFAYQNEIQAKKDRIEIIFTVAKPNKTYKGNVGFIDKLIDKNTIKNNTAAIACGPPLMYQSITKKLLSLGVKPKNIYYQLERRMHCGIGICQHCTCGDKYVCLDGPVFSYKELLKTNMSI